ncbi:hypothetical protein CLOHAE12215_01844 [Clostridium haemolyticum]|uniref:hypothetical protein n=1 Tax=Clostridium haemolyticum TaxID=84025 RepID=UPI001C39F48C|nr:hypothetical protein [Clostridium haemolyticum]CAG7840420.1 hypothetical protein CLOHAE12215_01844 [Clostridium haemolyticum]
METNELYNRKHQMYLKAVQDPNYDKLRVKIDDLNLIQCRADTKRKIMKPLRNTITLYSVYKFYINLGIVFRDKNKRYYTMEEIEQLTREYYKK